MYIYTRICWRYAPKNPSPCGVQPMTKQQPCAHARTCKRSVVGLRPMTTHDQTVQCGPLAPHDQCSPTL